MRLSGKAIAAAAAIVSASTLSAAAANWDVKKVFSNSELVSLADSALSARSITVIHMGDVNLTSGRIIAADPLTLFGAQAFARAVAPGRYPVTLYQAFGRIAAANMRFADGKPDHWELALVPGQDTKDLEGDQVYGYGVDAGLGSFMDAETLPLLNERDRQVQAEKGDQYISYYDDVLAAELARHEDDYVLHQPMPGKQGNIAIFSSGWGDGLYPSFWGLDKAGKPLVLLTEFYVIKNADGRTEPKWQ